MCLRMAGIKRKLEEVDISEIEKCSDGMTVHGVVTELSPVKVSRNSEKVKYFHGRVTDGKKTVRVVAFDPALRSSMKKSETTGTAVALMNWQVKETPVQFKDGEQRFEMVGSSHSKVEEAPHKEFKVMRRDSGKGQAEVKISEVEKVDVNQQVSVVAKVLSVKAPTSVVAKSGRVLVMQECTVGDASGTVRIVLWGSESKKLENEKCYIITGLTVKMYQGSKYLSLSDEGSVKPTGDLAEVADPPDEDECSNDDCIEGEIVGVLSVDEFKCCFNCRSKVNPISEAIGQCRKCAMKVKLNKCEISVTAHFVLEQNNGVRQNLTFFEKELEAIKGKGAGSGLEEQLLNLPAIKVCRNEKGIVYSVTVL